MKSTHLLGILMGLLSSSLTTAMEQHTKTTHHKPLFTQVSDDLGEKFVLYSLKSTSIATLFNTINSLRHVSSSWNKLFNESSFLQLICEHSTYPPEYKEFEEKLVRFYIDYLVSKDSLSSNNKTFITCLNDKKIKLRKYSHTLLKKFQDTFPQKGKLTQEDEIRANEYLMILCLYLAIEFYYWSSPTGPSKIHVYDIAMEKAILLLTVYFKIMGPTAIAMLKAFTENTFESENTKLRDWFNDSQVKLKTLQTLLRPSDNEQNNSTLLINKIRQQSVIFVKLDQVNVNTSANTIFTTFLNALDLSTDDRAFLEGAQKGNVEYINKAITEDNAYSCQLILDLALFRAVCHKQSQTADSLIIKLSSLLKLSAHELFLRVGFLNNTISLALHNDNIKIAKACVSYLTTPKITDNPQEFAKLKKMYNFLNKIRTDCLMRAPSRKIFKLIISHELFKKKPLP